MRAPLVVVGDCLLDRDLEGRVERMSPEAPVPVVEDFSTHPRPGGAGLAAMLAARDGREVALVTALASDPAGEELRTMLETAGVEVVDLGLRGRTPEKVRVRSQGRTLLRLDAGGPAGADAIGPATAEALSILGSAPAVLVSDYGRGIASEPSIRRTLAAPGHRRTLLWDPHPRGAPPVPGARLVKPNRQEAAADDDLFAIAVRARALRRAWRAEAVVVTLGDRGALLVSGEGAPLAVPAPRLALADACGAGDRFCATAAGLLAEGADTGQAVVAAVRAASAFVAAGGASAAARPERADAWGHLEGMERALAVAGETHARGGTVVATGGCFDLVHAGHVSTLRQARALGDCLVVCLNSDASVRRLKGPSRPLVPEADRATVLAALEFVDAVVVFDEPTPAAVLRRLRPDVFAKGGDYAGAELAERRVMGEWGGETVLLPYLEGRSTSRLVREARRAG